MYTIELDTRTRIIHVSAEGFWTLATLATFSAKILAYAAAAKLRYGDTASLIDIRKFPVQSPEVVKGVEFLKAKAAAITTAPTATVVGSQLSKMQADRALKADYMRVFMDHDEAVAWLDEVWVRKNARAA